MMDGTDRFALGDTVRYDDDEGELSSTVNTVADDGLLELENGDAIHPSWVTARCTTGVDRHE